MPSSSTGVRRLRNAGNETFETQSRWRKTSALSEGLKPEREGFRWRGFLEYPPLRRQMSVAMIEKRDRLAGTLQFMESRLQYLGRI